MDDTAGTDTWHPEDDTKENRPAPTHLCPELGIVLATVHKHTDVVTPRVI